MFSMVSPHGVSWSVPDLDRAIAYARQWTAFTGADCAIFDRYALVAAVTSEGALYRFEGGLHVTEQLDQGDNIPLRDDLGPEIPYEY